MYAHSKINTIKPFLSATVAMVVAGLLIVLDHVMPSIESHIIVGLWVILVTSILITIIQVVHTEKAFSMQFAQMAAQKERLANEIKHRLWAEKTSSENKARLQIVDEHFPVMLAYFNTEQRCCYHNQAFRQCFGLRPEQIENRFLYEFLHESFHIHTRHEIERVLSGEIVQNQHAQQLSNQSACLVTAHLIPHFNSGGKVVGFYTLYTPRFMEKNELFLENLKEKSALVSGQSYTRERTLNSGIDAEHQSMQASIDLSNRIVLAIEREEFRLFCQKILPVKSDRNATIYYEILIRMEEEESNLIPPGAFLSLVENHNLMPRLDEWVIKKLSSIFQKRKSVLRSHFV